MSKSKVKSVQIIPVDPYEEFPDVNFSQDSFSYNISFESNVDEYHLQILNNKNLIFDDTIFSQYNHIDLNIERSLIINSEDKSNLKIELLLFSFADQETYGFYLELPVFYKKCYLKHTLLDDKKNTSEFEINEGFEYQDTIYSNFGLLRFLDQR